MNMPLDRAALAGLNDVEVTKYIGISAAALCIYDFRTPRCIACSRSSRWAYVVLNLGDEVRLAAVSVLAVIH